MALTLTELVAKRELGLRAHGSLPSPSPSLTWAAATELADPTPFLDGGELLLTTGIRLRHASAQRDFVRLAHGAGVVALGFGVQLTHSKIPTAFVQEAEKLHLPVLEVPYQTPFMAIGRAVADAITTDHLSHMRQLFRDHRALSEQLIGGRGLDGLLRELASVLHTPVRLNQYGVPISSATGNKAPTTGVPAADRPDSGSWDKVPVATGMKDRCTLEILEPYAANPIVSYAQSLISLELSNRATALQARREHSAQVLADVFRGYIRDPEAQTRLANAGVDAHRRYAVLLVEVASSERTILLRMSLPQNWKDFPSAWVQDKLLVLVPEAELAHDPASLLHRYLYGAGLNAVIGVGHHYAGARGIHRSYLEALDALRHGAAVNPPGQLTMSSLLLLAEDVPTDRLSEQTLGPLKDFDDRHESELLMTLRTYLDLNGSIGAVADALGLHRNTVRYRIGQIAQLSGYNPALTADRVHLYLALEAWAP